MPVYSVNCEDAVPVHICSPCLKLEDREFGRIRSSGYIFADYLPVILANPTNVNNWIIGIQTGKIIIIPETAGEYDAGDPKALKGYGERAETYGPRTMTLKFIDPNLSVNYAHYNSLANQTELVPLFRTSSKVRIFDKPATIIAKDSAADDLESEIAWEVSAKVISSNLPIYVESTNLINTIFKCGYLNSIKDNVILPVYDTVLEFSAATTATAESVTGVVDAVDPVKKFYFNKVLNPVGLPQDMTIMVGTVEAVVITFKSEYLNLPFSYLHSDNTRKNGVFTNGTLTF